MPSKDYDDLPSLLLRSVNCNAFQESGRFEDRGRIKAEAKTEMQCAAVAMNA